MEDNLEFKYQIQETALCVILTSLGIRGFPLLFTRLDYWAMSRQQCF
jgi:hypothetical protein